MGKLIQTSGFSVSKGEALRLLRVFPLNVSIRKEAALLYKIDGDLEVGTTVSYRLVAGFRILEWQGKVLSVQGSEFIVEARAVFFAGFQAKHSLSSQGDILEISDEIFFNALPELSKALERASILYDFRSRAALISAKNNFESRRQTESFQAFQSGLSAG